MRSRQLYIGAVPLLLAGLASGCSLADADSRTTQTVGALKEGGAPSNDHILRVDHQVPIVSSVPANLGEHVTLAMRERVRANNGTPARDGRVVLFVHGATYPGPAVFDFGDGGYNWMNYLAQSGFDVFTFDRTGHGASPRPQMENPCNAFGPQQSLLIPRPLAAPCPNAYPYTLTNAGSDLAELDAAVEYIRALRSVEKVELIAWSLGGLYALEYAAAHPEKIDRMVLYAPAYFRVFPASPPPLPASGSPMNVNSRGTFEAAWNAEVGCSGQFDDGIRDAVWAEISASDPLGQSWGPASGILRSPRRTLWGMNQTLVKNVHIPSLILTGQFDRTVPNPGMLYDDLDVEQKVLVSVDCTSHLMVYESNHHILQRASKHWLLHGSLDGVRRGKLAVNADGQLRVLDRELPDPEIDPDDLRN